MSEPVSLIMVQFLDWVASRPRTYAEAMDAWRTSCPRLSVWEDALLAGLIQVGRCGPTRQAEVTLTPRGRALLDGSRTRAQNHRPPREQKEARPPPGELGPEKPA